MQIRQTSWTRLIICAAILWVFWAAAATWAQEPNPGAVEAVQPAEATDLWTFVKEIFSNLFNSRELMKTLGSLSSSPLSRST